MVIRQQPTPSEILALWKIAPFGSLSRNGICVRLGASGGGALGSGWLLMVLGRSSGVQGHAGRIAGGPWCRKYDPAAQVEGDGGDQ